jgi:hypothetical protein
MALELLGLSQRDTGPSPDVVAEPSPGDWSCDVLARVLAALLGQSLTPEQVRDKAIALGLLRCPASDGPLTLPAQEACRLFLSGYRLPAYIEIGTSATLTIHLQQGRQVFVLLADRDGDGTKAPALYQVQGFLTEQTSAVEVHRVELGALPGLSRSLEANTFAAAWAQTGSRAIVAARSWSDLPIGFGAFFGGSCDRDGAYHWDMAECDTDGAGQVLRVCR